MRYVEFLGMSFFVIGEQFATIVAVAVFSLPIMWALAAAFRRLMEPKGKGKNDS